MQPDTPDKQPRRGVINFQDFDSEPATPAPQHDTPPREQSASGLAFISFGSGSSGNCSYIGTAEQGVLIDAGIEPDKVFDALHRNGIKPTAVKAIVLTHDHQDHVRYVYKTIRTYNKNLAVYCTMRVMNGLLRRHNISRRIREYKIDIWHETPFKIAGMEFTAFETSHDGTDNVGFSIRFGDYTFVVATDMGVITERAAHYMAQANFLMIESNYDRAMLDNGRYPEYLKQRVRGPHGHLDNAVAADFVARHASKRLQWVFLCHLSNDNNTPQIALRTMRAALESAGLTVGDASNTPDQRNRDVQLYALPRYESSPWFVL